MRKYLFIATILFSFCGSKPTLQLNLTGTTGAFDDAGVVDIVFTIQNIPTAEGGLDQDGDGVPDAFVYPSACGSTKPATCGFPPDSGTNVTVGDIPLGFQYTVTVELRNSAGTVLYNGEATFNNEENTAPITVSVD